MTTARTMNVSRAELLRRKEVLAQGPLTWSDADITAIAGFTSVPYDDLVTMRHKMERAAQWSIDNLRALDEVVVASDRPAALRRDVERGGSLVSALREAETYTGLFPRLKAEIAAIDDQLRSGRRRFSLRRS